MAEQQLQEWQLQEWQLRRHKRSHPFKDPTSTVRSSGCTLLNLAVKIQRFSNPEGVGGQCRSALEAELRGESCDRSEGWG